MKMNLKTTVLTVILLSGLFSSYAQEQKTTQQLLMGKTWDMQGMMGKTMSEAYDENTITVYYNGKELGKDEYYLSDVIEVEFDTSKVGRMSEGKYIVHRAKKEKGYKEELPVTVLEIVQLDETMLTLKNIKNEHVLLEYKRK